MLTHGSKRTRLTDSKFKEPRGDDMRQIFTQWAKDRGVEINGVKPERHPGRGVGLVTSKHLKQGDRLLFIPEKAMFKPDPSLLKREALDRASPQAQLAISAMLTFGGEMASIKLWESVWPTRNDFEESMPMCWPAALQQQLPPSVHQPLERQLSDYQKDWNAARELCNRRDLDEDDFKYYWMIVNSRSFHWKPPRQKAGVMVMCPFIDYINHSPTGSSCHVSQTAKGYEVEANRNYEPGEEILATYGAHSNEKLLVHYGFICSNTSTGPSVDDDIRLDHIIIPNLDPKVRDQLQDVGFLGAYALLPASNELCFKTQVAVRAALLTSNEWEYYIANGEDLAVDQTPIVYEFVKKLLQDYRVDAVQKLQVLREQEDTTVRAILCLRWTQIIEAIDAFSKA